jgi:hypothetical protein
MSGLLSRLMASIEQAEQLKRSAEKADRRRFEGTPPTGFGELPELTRDQVAAMDDMAEWGAR